MGRHQFAVLCLLTAVSYGFFLEGEEKSNKVERKGNKKSAEPAMNFVLKHVPTNYLPVLERNDKKTDAFFWSQIEEKLAVAKLPTIEKALAAAVEYDSKTLHMIDSNASAKMISLLRLGRNIKDFGGRGDLVWIVQIMDGLNDDVIGEVWINARNGEIRSIFPPVE